MFCIQLAMITLKKKMDLQSTIVQLLKSQAEQQKHEEKLLQMMELLKRTQDIKPTGIDCMALFDLWDLPLNL